VTIGNPNPSAAEWDSVEESNICRQRWNEEGVWQEILLLRIERHKKFGSQEGDRSQIPFPR
jgi:hypothetical protein